MIVLLVEIFESIVCKGRNFQWIPSTVEPVNGIMVHMFLKLLDIMISNIGHDSLHLIENNALENNRSGYITRVNMF